MSGVSGQDPEGPVELVEVTVAEAVVVVAAMDAIADSPRRCRRGGRWWRWPLSALVLFVEGLVLILVFGGSILSWRAAQGPVDLSWMLPRLSRMVAVAAPDYRISVSHLTFNWRGFTRGPGQPVQIAADGIRIAEPARKRSLTLDHLSLDLSAAWATRGVFAPRVMTLDGLHILLQRDTASAAPHVPPAHPHERDMQAIARDVIAVLRAPPQTDQHLVPVRDPGLSELERVTITGSSIVLEPAAPELAAPQPAAPQPGAPQPAAPQPGAPDLSNRALQLAKFTLVAARADQGGLSLHVSAVLASRAGPLPPATAGERPSLSLRGRVTSAGAVTLDAAAALQDPAGMAAALGLSPSLPVPAMALRASAHLTATADAEITAIAAAVSGGAGEMRVDGARIPVTALDLRLAGDAQSLWVDPASRLVLGAVSAAPPPTIGISGSLHRMGAGWSGTLGLGIDHVTSDDLPAYWPPALAPGALDWIRTQIHRGGLSHGTFAFGFESQQGFSDIALVSAAGGISAAGLSVAWLPPLPPLTGVNGSILLQGLDAIAIKVDAAQQGALTLKPSSMVISGLNAETQIGAISVNLSGPAAAAVSLLNQPRLGLLKSVPMPLAVTAGTARVAVKITLPLLDDVKIAQIALQSHAELIGLGLSGLLPGRDLTDGNFTIDTSTAALRMAGQCRLASIPLQLTLKAIFGPTAPDQAVATARLRATASPAELSAAGLPMTEMLAGDLSALVDVSATQSGRTDINARLTLPAAHVRVSPIGWAGGAGEVRGTAHIVLQGSRITNFEPVVFKGPGIDVAVQPEFTGARLSALDIPRFILGGTDITGRIGLPTRPGAAYAIRLRGRRLDLAGLFRSKGQPSVGPTNEALSQISSRSEFAPHPPWTADVALGAIVFGQRANGQPREFNAVRGQAVNNGRIVQSADVSLTIAPSGAKAHLLVKQNGQGGRQVTVTSGDLGGFLKAANIYDGVNGGVVRVDATYNDRLTTHPLTGTAEVGKFTLGDAPTIGKVLQAVTIYGIVDMLRGPGLYFSRLVMPFRLESRMLTLIDTRAYSASLGLTAKGTIDLPTNRFNIKGTVVPAYFFNSLLGHIPVIGRLFSPEKGGGLFAANFTVTGPIDNPAVKVNPLSLVAPGILRNLFGKASPAEVARKR